MISWGKPEPGKFKLNVDGSRSNDGVIKEGGVISDESGNWTNGFMINIVLVKFFRLKLGVSSMVCSWLLLVYRLEISL